MQETVHLSLVRPTLVLGIERPLALSAIGLAVLIPLAGDLHLLPVLLSGFIAFGLFPVLRAAAKHDELLSRVYIRHLSYQPWYPAAAHPAAATQLIHAFHDGAY